MGSWAKLPLPVGLGLPRGPVGGVRARAAATTVAGPHLECKCRRGRRNLHQPPQHKARPGTKVPRQSLRVVLRTREQHTAAAARAALVLYICFAAAPAVTPLHRWDLPLLGLLITTRPPQGCLRGRRPQTYRIIIIISSSSSRKGFRQERSQSSGGWSGCT